MTTKQQLIESAVTKIVKKVLREQGNRGGYYISYYATVGEHGETGKKYSDFKSALRDAIKHANDPEFMDGLEYVGVEPFGSEKQFGIVYITQKYANHASSTFDDPADKKIWDSVASKVLHGQSRSGGKQVVPQTGTFI